MSERRQIYVDGYGTFQVKVKFLDVYDEQFIIYALYASVVSNVSQAPVRKLEPRETRLIVPTSAPCAQLVAGCARVVS